MSGEKIKLTSLSHGGGCGCKISSAMLAELLGGMAENSAPPQLLVGNNTGDDAAVFALSAERAVVATTDFFTPIVDDPEDFGRIAAANALSDVYAMGAKPLLALNVVGMPIKKLSSGVIAAVLRGGQRVCAQAGVVVAGGHSIDLAEPVYGLAVVGEVHPDRIKRNAGAHEGDALILSKPLGIGVIAAAIKRGLASDEACRQMLQSATLLNASGEKLGACAGVHAMTDVTGFGLLGHLLEMCEASGVGAQIYRRRVPLIASAHELMARDITTGGMRRNRDHHARGVDFGDADEKQINLFCDPQTNGGLLVACAPDDADEVLALLRRDGCEFAAVIGRITPPGSVRLCDG